PLTRDAPCTRRTPIRSLFILPIRPPPGSPLFPYTTLFRSRTIFLFKSQRFNRIKFRSLARRIISRDQSNKNTNQHSDQHLCPGRSEEHTSELQSRENIVCRLLLEKKNMTPSISVMRVASSH